MGLFRTVFQNSLLNSEGNLRFGTSTAVSDNHSKVNTQYSFINRPKRPRMPQIASLPGFVTVSAVASLLQAATSYGCVKEYSMIF